jgi:hypothetical protein
MSGVHRLLIQNRKWSHFAKERQMPLYHFAGTCKDGKKTVGIGSQNLTKSNAYNLNAGAASRCSTLVGEPVHPNAATNLERECIS